MRKPNPFVSFVLDQLSEIEHLTARQMFGGTGLYSGAVFFGIIFRDILYLKVDDNTRPAYRRAGMKPFKPYAGRPTTMQYYGVPVAVLENPHDLAAWARRAIAAAAAAERQRSTRPRGRHVTHARSTRSSSRARN